MLKLRACLILCVAAALTGSAAAAPAAKGVRPTDHIPGFDGPMTTVAGPDGRTWVAWAYRSSHESDIAISVQDGTTTAWSEPVFLGHGNGFDDVDPALAVDSRGAIYLAFTTTSPSRVAVATLAIGSTTWSKPVVVSGAEAAASPSLMIVGDRLIVAYRTARGVGLIQLPTLGSANEIDGLGDGTDPFGIKGQLPIGGPAPASTRTP
jgi:hypothetical protein